MIGELDVLRSHLLDCGRETLEYFVYDHFYREVKSVAGDHIDQDGIQRIMMQFQEKMDAMSLMQLVDVAAEVMAIQAKMN